MRSYSPALCVWVWVCMFVCSCLQYTRVFKFFCLNVSCVRFLWALTCAVTCAAHVKAALNVDKRSDSLPLAHTFTHQILTVPFLHSALKGSILMTVNSPDNSALSIFRQYYSVVKWTNTQRMRLLAGLMMPDWLAAADTSGDEDVIYPFLTLSLSLSLYPLSLCLALLSHTSFHLEAALV